MYLTQKIILILPFRGSIRTLCYSLKIVAFAQEEAPQFFTYPSHSIMHQPNIHDAHCLPSVRYCAWCRRLCGVHILLPKMHLDSGAIPSSEATIHLQPNFFHCNYNLWMSFLIKALPTSVTSHTKPPL